MADNRDYQEWRSPLGHDMRIGPSDGHTGRGVEDDSDLFHHLPPRSRCFLPDHDLDGAPEEEYVDGALLRFEFSADPARLLKALPCERRAPNIIIQVQIERGPIHWKKIRPTCSSDSCRIRQYRIRSY